MIYEGILKGKYVDLISATEDDAEFTLLIRQDPNLIKFIPKLNITVEQQKNWIRKQRNQQSDYFFVIWDKCFNRIGTIGLYDIKGNCGETGRLVVMGNALMSIEASLLFLDFAFDILCLDKTINYVLVNNTKAIRYAKMFGSDFSSAYSDKSGNERMYGVITKDSYKKERNKIEKILYR